MHAKTQTAMADLRRFMALHHVQPGEKLPSERELAELLGVGRGAVVSILNALAANGEITLTPQGKAVCAAKPVSRRRKLLYLACCEVDFMVGQVPGSPQFHGLLEAAEHFDFELEIHHSDYCNLTFEYLDRIQNGEISGVVMIQNHHPPSVQNLLDKNIPCVIACCENPVSYPNVAMDFRSAGRMAARELIQSGVRNFGTITGDLNTWIYHEMLAGFRGGLAEEGIWLEEKNIYEMGKIVDTRQTADALEAYLLQGIPEGIFTMRAYRAQFLYSYCLTHRIRIPEDLSVISFDQHTWGAAQDVGLSAIPELRYQLGYQAVEMLDEWMKSGVRPESRKLLAPAVHLHSLRGESAR